MSKKILKLISIFLLLAVLFTGCSSPATQEEHRKQLKSQELVQAKKF